MADALRLPAERRWADELAALAAVDADPRPAGWRLSPRAVQTFILGSGDAPIAWTDGDGQAHETVIGKKFYGADVLVQRAIVTLASDRGLLLIGEPGTAKSWLSEHLAAAISGSSLLTVQGTAGLTEDQIKYGWNYALLLAEGPSEKALVPGPLYRAMQGGQVMRFEEITRAPHEVQDTLLSALSDKVITLPELPGDAGVVLARPGFNLIATANTRDRGVNEMSSALKRRFNFETVPPVQALNEEVRIVREQVGRLLDEGGHTATLGDDVLELLVTTFHEVRQGQTLEGVQLDRPSQGVMSTAEAVSVGLNAALFASFFADGQVTPEHLALQLGGVVAKDAREDLKVIRAYFDVAVKPRAQRAEGAWKAYYAARKLLS
ncbi:MAG: AAA family ATPase [Myxococcales bacterium]|nr:AAA family ATPase [Myxococcales bacterium]MCB9523221.1 AAA family ATPase [Myxococcales bacterium]